MTISAKWHSHRQDNKGRREMLKAIDGASSETVRAELIAIAVRNNQFLMR
ncbi:MAG: hypothetical protein ABI137_10735 [Antricoccus sp.]